MRHACQVWAAALITLLHPWNARAAQRGDSTSALTVSATRGVIEALGAHQVVLLGESHRSVPFHRFLRDLIRTPQFAGTGVTDIVVEFGNMRYQPLLDRYIAGDSVPHDSLQLVWRNTTQPLVWNAPVYEELLSAVRRLNGSRPTDSRVRVLAGDPPIDWDGTRSPADFPRSYGDRDIETLRMMEREVYAKHRKALVIIGGAHIYREGPGDRERPRVLERASLGDQLHRLHPGTAFVIETVFGDSRASLLELLRPVMLPGEMVFVDRAGLGNVSSVALFGPMTFLRRVEGKMEPVKLPASDFPTLGRTLDALIYLADENPSEQEPPGLYQGNPEYVRELRRRIVILTKVFGVDIWTEDLDEQLHRR